MYRLRDAFLHMFAHHKTSVCTLFDLHGRVRMQIFSWEDVSVYNLSHNFLRLGSTDMFSTQCVEYKTCSCACSHTKRPVSAHFLSYEVISTRNVKHMTPFFVTKFSIDKMIRCTTVWLNLRTLLSMQFFTYKVLSENSGVPYVLWQASCFHTNISTLSCSCTSSHTERRGLCVTLNISHLVCHIISHRCSRNKVQHHNFF